MLHSLRLAVFFAAFLGSSTALQFPLAFPAVHTPSAATHARAVSHAMAASPLEEEITSAIAASKVVVFSKDYCPFCTKTKATLDGMGVDYTVIEINLLPNGAEYQAALTTISGQRTVPNVYVGGTHIGGNDGAPSPPSLPIFPFRTHCLSR